VWKTARERREKDGESKKEKEGKEKSHAFVVVNARATPQLMLVGPQS
jgi:hypothetical protein